MKKNSKFLLAIVTASCLTASVFGLTACNNTPKPSEKPEDKDPPPVVLEKKDLTDGLNTVAFTADNAEKGIIYTYTATEAGTYAFAVAGSNASVKVNDAAVTSYVADLAAGGKVELVCASTTDESATYSVYAGKATTVTVGEDAENMFDIPAYGTYAMYTVSVVTAGDYDFEFYDDYFFDDTVSTDYSIIVNGESYGTTAFFDYITTIPLTAGNNVVVVSTNLTENDVKDKQVLVTVTAHVEEEAKTVTVGDNAVQANYDGVTYTFTAPESANYTFSVDTANDNIYVDVNEGNGIGNSFGEITESVTIAMIKGSSISVACLTNTEGDDSYNITITKSALPSSVEIGSDGGSAVVGVDGNKTATVTFKTPDAGNYALNLFDLAVDDKVTVTIGDGAPAEVTITQNQFTGEARGIVTFAVEAGSGDVVITIVCPDGTTAISVEITYLGTE